MLKRKMIRDIKLNLSQFLTIFLMVLIGVMAYVGIEAYMDGMQSASDKFYSGNNLQDLNVIGENFTKDDLKKIKELKNVSDAERKLSLTATTNNDKTLLLNFIESNNISQFYIVDGEKFDVNKHGVWLDSYYAEKNNIKVNDEITIKYDTFTIKEKVRGLIMTPDHIYDVKDESELYPNRENLGFAYVSINEMPESYIKGKVMKEMGITDSKVFDKYVKNFNYKDYLVFNYVMVDVNEKSNVSKVKSDIENNIDNALVVINIEDTASYLTYQGEINEGKTYVGVFSGLFLLIAILSVITTMTRVVNKQRIQIGTLKALGFKDSKIIMHYVSYGLFISFAAAICGILAGYFFIGKTFIGLEMSFFEMPNGKPIVDIQDILVSLLVMVIISFITYLTCKNILKENAAETLRSKLPDVKKNSLNITTKGIFKRMSFQSKWNIRDILRNKMRTVMGIVGVTGCCMLIVTAFGMLDSLNYFVKLQFTDLYNFKYKLSLNNVNNKELKEITNKYGDKTSESLGIEFLNNDEKISSTIFVDNSNDYVRFVDNKNKFIKLDNTDGIYVTYKLAEKYNLEKGETIKWHVYGSDKYYESKIVGFNKDPQNQIITINKKYLDKLNIKYKPDTVYTNDDLSNVKEIKNVELIQDKVALESGMSNMLNTMKTMIILIIGIAVVLGSVIIYNLGILSYTEKQYQFSTLKVLGFSDKKIKKIFIMQNNWIAVISIILGLPSGYTLVDWLFKEAIEEHYDFQAHIEPLTYLIAAIGTFIVSYLVSKFLARKVNNIDMVSSLKGNE